MDERHHLISARMKESDLIGRFVCGGNKTHPVVDGDKIFLFSPCFPLVFFGGGSPNYYPVTFFHMFLPADFPASHRDLRTFAGRRAESCVDVWVCALRVYGDDEGAFCLGDRVY